MNQYQEHNLGMLSDQILSRLKAGDWRNAPSPILLCVCCGKYRITTPNLKHYDWDGTRVKCWDCQHLRKGGEYYL